MRRKDREVTNESELIDILESCRTCHVAMNKDDYPYIIPLSYGYDLEEGTLNLYFHSAFEGEKIDLWKKNNKVSFEISSEGMPVHAETPCNSGYYFSSLIGKGELVFIQDMEEKMMALSKMFYRQTGKKIDFNAQQAGTVCVYKITSKHFTGKRKPMPGK